MTREIVIPDFPLNVHPVKTIRQIRGVDVIFYTNVPPTSAYRYAVHTRNISWDLLPLGFLNEIGLLPAYHGPSFLEARGNNDYVIRATSPWIEDYEKRMEAEKPKTGAEPGKDKEKKTETEQKEEVSETIKRRRWISAMEEEMQKPTNTLTSADVTSIFSQFSSGGPLAHLRVGKFQIPVYTIYTLDQRKNEALLLRQITFKDITDAYEAMSSGTGLDSLVFPFAEAVGNYDNLRGATYSLVEGYLEKLKDRDERAQKELDRIKKEVADEDVMIDVMERSLLP